MKFLKVAGALAALAFSMGVASAANADTYTLNLTQSQTGAVPYGQVAVTQAGANTLQFSVTLFDGLHFVDTGAHNAFTFSLVGAPTLTNFTVTSGGSFTLTQSTTNSIDNSPFAGFDYGVGCTTSCEQGNGGYTGPLVFTVTAAGLTPSSIDFATGTFNNQQIRFAADTINGAGLTAAVGGGTLVPGVPEVSTWGMMILGFGMVGLGLRMRRRPVLAA